MALWVLVLAESSIRMLFCWLLESKRCYFVAKIEFDFESLADKFGFRCFLCSIAESLLIVNSLLHFDRLQQI